MQSAHDLDFWAKTVFDLQRTMVPHVYTLTGNLLAEHTFEFDHWAPGKTHRARHASFQVGGKGINVSKMLMRLGIPNTALCFAGGDPGSACTRWLRERGFDARVFASATPTREGLVVRSGTAPETTFLGPDTTPDAAAIQSCATFLDGQPGGNVLALCGSFPGWDQADFDPLRDALARWLSRGCLVADTYGPPLAWVARQPLELLKINATELRTLGPGDPRASVAALRYVITDGPNAIRLKDGLAPETSVTPPAIREVSPTGSGDVMLACLLKALFIDRKPLQEAVKFAVPYAAANAGHPGVAEFPDPA